MKILYSFKVDKASFEEKTTKNEEGVETVEKVKVNTPVEVYIKKPSHREIDNMDLFYSIQLSELQSKGISTNTMILNSYQDSGGLDSKNEVEAMKKLIQDLNIKRNRLYKNMAEKVEDQGLLEEVKDLTIELQEYQNKLSSIFDRSAESIAERRVILWTCLFLLFVKDGDVYKQIFSGKDFDEKMESYYNILDTEDDSYDFEKFAFEKGNVLLTSWLKKQAENEEDFKLLESILDGTDVADDESA